MQRLYEAECEQSTLKQTNSLVGVTENEILLFRNQLKVNFNWNWLWDNFLDFPKAVNPDRGSMVFCKLIFFSIFISDSKC